MHLPAALCCGVILNEKTWEDSNPQQLCNVSCTEHVDGV